VVVPANVRRVGVLLQNTSDTAISIKMDDSDTALTADNGFVLLPNESLSFATKDHQCFAPIFAIHGGSGTKVLRVQEFERA
jgi:hypothetical protein